MAILTMRGDFIITSLGEDKRVLAWVLGSLNSHLGSNRPKAPNEGITRTTT